MDQRQTIKSYYHYPLRSFLRNKRAYVLLACSILCMVILCASVLIYYASSYEAEVEMLRRVNGPQHTQFYDLDPLLVPDYTEKTYIRDYTAIDIFASADNRMIWHRFHRSTLPSIPKRPRTIFICG